MSVNDSTMPMPKRVSDYLIRKGDMEALRVLVNANKPRSWNIEKILANFVKYGV